MPELPEVETIVRDLNKYLPGKVIKSFQLFNKKTINLSLAVWRRQVVGVKITKVWRRGKQIIIDLVGDKHLVIHLKMTGQLIWCGKHDLVVGGHPIVGVGEELPNKFTRAVFSLSDGGELYFNDVRKFGYIKLVSAKELDIALTRLGLEPLAKSFNDKKLKLALANSPKAKIKPALLDQTKVVGIGNIYADESLWRAGILPSRIVASLKDAEWKVLAKAIVGVLKLSITHRGTSFSNYRDAQGSSGNFIKKLKVYGRGGKECLKCGKILHKSKLGGRGTVWCEHCQR